MLKYGKTAAIRPQAGFLLIEAMIAILIFSLGIVALMGLQSIAIGDSVHGKYRTDASYFANGIIAQMMVDRANVASYADGASPSTRRTEWDAEVAASLPNGTTSVTIAGSAVTVIVYWRNPNESSSHNFTTFSQVVF